MKIVEVFFRGTIRRFVGEDMRWVTSDAYGLKIYDGDKILVEFRPGSWDYVKSVEGVQTPMTYTLNAGTNTTVVKPQVQYYKFNE